MKLSLAMMIAVGVAGCITPAPDEAFCGPVFADLIAQQRAALEAHPETPQAVGEAGTDVVIGHEAGCDNGL